MIKQWFKALRCLHNRTYNIVHLELVLTVSDSFILVASIELSVIYYNLYVVELGPVLVDIFKLSLFLSMLNVYRV